MTDQVMATDFLISAKSAVQNYAVAITETASPEVKIILKNQLRDAHNAIKEGFNNSLQRYFNQSLAATPVTPVTPRSWGGMGTVGGWRRSFSRFLDGNSVTV